VLLDDGLLLERKSSPIGVLLIIFEARPEVIANIASLAIKSGNAAILKGLFISRNVQWLTTTGGKESVESFRTIATLVSAALSKTKVPNDALQLVTTRDAITPLLALDDCIDLVIPRGGNELVRTVKRGTSIPVLGHADGLCTVYLRADCPAKMAVDVLLDAKLSYTAACNSVETLLVDEDALMGAFVDAAIALAEAGVQLRCDEPALAVLTKYLPAAHQGKLKPSTPKDYSTEFLDLILAVKTLPRQPTPAAAALAAAEHINAHSSHHTDAILTTSSEAATAFLAAVDSAGVFHNASTRFADGQRFGFGTEVGISTSKIHARGPVGLAGLTIYRWLLVGDGHVSTAYGGAGGKAWVHRRLAAGEGEWVARDEEEMEALRAVRRKRAGQQQQ
jgi:glutamate-5-semialdehyde dehydrogenase